MDRASFGKQLVNTVATVAAVSGPGNVVMKVWAIVTQLITWLQGLPKDDVDYFIDLIEANNVKNKTVMTAMRLLRLLMQCPDEIGEDQENPI